MPAESIDLPNIKSMISQPMAGVTKRKRVDENIATSQEDIHKKKPSTVLMWFKNDLRSSDNPALLAATQLAKRHEYYTIALFVISPQDYFIHDDAAIKIDFRLRCLNKLREKLAVLNIPLVILTVNRRKNIPETLLEFCRARKVYQLFYNAEYEVDELRRDATVTQLLEADGRKVSCFHDQCIVFPRALLTKTDQPFKVYTPFKKTWCAHIESNICPKTKAPSLLILAESPLPNAFEIRQQSQFIDLFESEIPKSIKGFELDGGYAALARKRYPAGENAALKRLHTFLETKVQNYNERRNVPAKEGTSVLSPYLASGVISIRQCVRAAWEVNGRKLSTGQNGIVSWISELIWREFYRHVLVHFPQVSMNRPFKPEAASLSWELDVNGENFKAWSEGRTGYPIVDAGMRQLKSTGWMDNRLRMCTAMFLTKDLLLNWQLGEKFFMQHLIDGDLAQNNGGWQWCASTGTDAAPYFRIFNPLLQSEKIDPNGDIIRKYIPELAHLKSPVIHDPYHRLPKQEFDKLGYPPPIVDHKMARERALAAFKKVLSKK
ncbi:uncharacterized protein VTP21DRAFT_1231 [Calcarisporiella thermophila]|uniref:uncharacterized protein n=1 Tax=Calcarisporiella thermophila TaxID=911321 RepID=UPI003743B549